MMVCTMVAENPERAAPAEDWRKERRMHPEVEREYHGDGFLVTWEPGLCVHATMCYRTLPEVFQPWARPWVHPREASLEEIEATVALCPSAALKFERIPAPETETESETDQD
jgi:uncharacterized Fe-S cluster protein YjdI